MSTPTPPGPDPQGSHHWVMSISWPASPGREETATYRSTVTPKPSETRAEIYEIVRQFMVDDVTGGRPPTVLFWSLEPNQIGGAA